MTGPGIITKLFTVDINWEILELDPPTGKVSMYQKKINRGLGRKKRERFKELAFNGEIEVSSRFQTDIAIKKMRDMYTPVSHYIILFCYLIFRSFIVIL